MIQVRTSNRSDIHALMDIDLKCHEFPWDAGDWTRRSEDKKHRFWSAEYFKEIVGFAAISIEKDDVKQWVQIWKLGVKEPYRRKGIGSALMSEVLAASKALKVNTFMLLPEWVCDPGRPAPEFLRYHKFQATSVTTDYYNYLGAPGDGYVFKRPQ